MTDIVERLRENADLDAAEHVPHEVVQMQYEAADEIERLRAELLAAKNQTQYEPAETSKGAGN